MNYMQLRCESRVQLSIAAGGGEVVGGSFHGDDMASRADGIGQHQCDNTLVSTEIKHAPARTQSVPFEQYDFRQFRPVIVIPTLGKRIAQLDAQRAAAVVMTDNPAAVTGDHAADPRGS